MKRIVAIALIFLMSGQCLFKLGVVTYFGINRNYIAEVLCINKEAPITMCYGKCFLDKNLKLADEAEKSSAPASKHKLEIPVFMVYENKYQFDTGSHTNAMGWTAYHSSVTPGFTPAIFHPPAALS